MEIAGGAAPGIIMGVVEYSSELAIILKLERDQHVWLRSRSLWF